MKQAMPMVSERKSYFVATDSLLIAKTGICVRILT